MSNNEKINDVISRKYEVFEMSNNEKRNDVISRKSITLIPHL